MPDCNILSIRSVQKEGSELDIQSVQLEVSCNSECIETEEVVVGWTISGDVETSLGRFVSGRFGQGTGKKTLRRKS
jgi:hypothetical protein